MIEKSFQGTEEGVLLLALVLPLLPGDDRPDSGSALYVKVGVR